ncbi:hypothetical protein D6774_00845 [Candidatus Woesearchaeota archaeon]|jgi:dolichol kinase|nr:MAG: hypothetical protein D6774_00845 [Candidatus Woesearchaeota archaeon]
MVLAREIRRQVLHLLVGVVLALLIFYGFIGILGLLIILIIGLIISALATEYDLLFISWFLKRFDRPEDRYFPGRGAIAMVAGALLSLTLFGSQIATASLLILAFADSFSHIVGRALGKRPHPLNGKKLWEGSVAGTLMGTIAAWAVVPLWAAFFASVVAMLVEAIEIRVKGVFLDDNLIIPVVAGAVLALLL